MFDLENFYANMKPGEDPSQGACCYYIESAQYPQAFKPSHKNVTTHTPTLSFPSIIPAGLTYEEWLQRNPIPDKWLKRLERDEEELEAAQRMPGLR